MKNEILGRYEIIESLTSGGMAEVYLARVAGEKKAGKIFALKKVRSELSNDEAFRKMFEREIGLATALSHPNIVRIFDFGMSDGVYFMVMEYVRGQPMQILAQKNAAQDTLPEIGFPCFAVSRVCRALAYAHAYCDPVTRKHAGIVHCDISPQNVLVGFDGHVKLFDFGVASLGSKEEGKPGMIRGKPAYLSPEQALGEPPDDRSDIFSIGIVLWEFLTASRLFYDDVPLNALRRVLHQEIPPPSSINPKVPKSLDAITLKALARDRMVRYQLASELGQELDRALHNEGIVFAEKQTRELMVNYFGAPKAPEKAQSKKTGMLSENELASSKGQSFLGAFSENLVKIAAAVAILAGLSWGALLWLRPDAPAIAPEPAPARLATPLASAQAVDPHVLSPEVLGELKNYQVQVVSVADSESGTVSVTVESSQGEWPIALVLSSIGAVKWQVTASPNAKLERVYFSSQSPGSSVALGRELGAMNSQQIHLALVPFSTENHLPLLSRAPPKASWKLATPEEVAGLLGMVYCLADASQAHEVSTSQCREINPTL